MEDNTTDQQQAKSKKDVGKSWLTWLLIALIVILLAGGGYLWWLLLEANKKVSDLKKTNSGLAQQIIDLQKGEIGNDDESADDQACNDAPTQTMKDNIKAALDTKNTAAFSTYVTDPVRYVLAASEYGGDVSPAEAATSLEYTHSATDPWDFNLPAATVAAWDGGFYTDYFDANTYVGRAASGMVATFDFDCNGKIKQIFVAADEDLL